MRTMQLLALLLLAAAVAVLHMWALPDLPRGLYIDESSIGLNAASIAATGRDEHHVLFPVFFQAFGEWKNPLYIYVVAALFRIFSVSVLMLRFTSALFFFIFLGALIWFCRHQFPHRPGICLYALCAAGVLPWFFPVSRVSFEVISQLTIVMIALTLLQRVYAHGTAPPPRYYPLLAGLCVGLSVYSYSTGRLLSFFLLGALGLAYAHRRYLLRHALVVSGFLVSLIPYLLFSFGHPEALSTRFERVSFVYNNPALGLWDKMTIFLTYYGSYFGPSFLLFKGDSNLRHHTGTGGETFIAVFVLALVGLGWLLWKKRQPGDRFARFLLLNALVTPIAGALTEPSHALRSILLGLYLVIISCYGVEAVARLPRKRLAHSVFVACSLVLSLESGHYLWDYFVVYPAKTEAAFESYDFEATLRAAIGVHPAEIVVSNKGNKPYAQLEFYRYVLSDPGSLSITLGPAVARPERCVIYTPNDTGIAEEQRYATTFQVENGFSRARCFR